MKVLAIETSCDETAVSVIEIDGDTVAVLSNVISSQVALHAQYGGVVPALAAREHAANIGHVFEQALVDAGNPDIDLIAVTNGPGLGPALIVGITFSRTLAWLWDKPLIGVNHMDGHIHSNWLKPITEVSSSKFQVPSFPALNLIVSGGHTELVIMRDHGDYEIIGETQDDAIGEAFDKVARMLGLGYPGGPAIAKLAQIGNPQAYNLPRPMAKSGDYHFSYSGLKTAVLYLIRDLTKIAPLTEQQHADIAASFQEAAVDVLIQKTKLSTISYQPSALLLSGGVSANTLLRERLTNMGAELGIPVFIPAMKYTTDNAAMIAMAGYFSYMNSKTDFSWKSVRMDANLRLSRGR